MKIAIVGTKGIPATYGGFETFAFQLAKHLSGASHEITVVNEKGCNSYYKRGWIRTSSKEVYLFATQISFCIAKICSDVQRPSCG